ncbi:coiled-coil domain-containing protein 96-like [Sycon ciliatum]|uniref:coiled-coil domain-containing protein 96-like n=1 Tax=Sycon ciliatum TaxID=27933 RepID=UPI0031F61C00
MSEPESAAEDIAANDAAEVGNAGETAAEGEIAAATGDASSEANAEPGTRTPQPEDAAGVEATSAENPESDQGQGADGGEKAAANESQTHGASATDAGDDVGDAQAAPGATEDYDAGPSAIDVVLDNATEQQDSAASPPDGDAPEDAQQHEGAEEATTGSPQAAQQAAESVDSDAATVAAAEDQVERTESEDGATESAADEKSPGEDGESGDEGEANGKEEEPIADTDAAVPPAQQTGATEEVKTINRDEISQKIMHMTQEADMAATLCLKEQQKIAEYLRTKKRGDDGKQLKHQQQLSQTEETTRFIKYLEMLEDIKSAQLHQKRLYEAQLLGLQSEVHDLRTQLSDEMSALKEKRRYVALHSFSSATGKPLKLDDLEAYEVDEWMKEDEVRRIRLETIRQRIKLAKREAVLQQHEVLPDGTCLNIIDFEQLKVENASLFETTESRSADVKRLEGKIS